MIDIIIPTLGRPHALQRVADNIRDTTGNSHRITFVVEASEEDTLVPNGCRVVVNGEEPSYSNAFQAGFAATDGDYFLNGNDDFDFQPGWDLEPVKILFVFPEISVLGLNDGSDGCSFTAILLARRSYVEERSGVIGMERRVFYPYKHNFVDTEFAHTAMKRGVYAKCPEAKILHKHPDFGLAVEDETYRKSRATMGEDSQTFHSRVHLWA